MQDAARPPGNNSQGGMGAEKQAELSSRNIGGGGQFSGACSRGHSRPQFCWQFKQSEVAVSSTELLVQASVQQQILSISSDGKLALEHSSHNSFSPPASFEGAVLGNYNNRCVARPPPPPPLSTLPPAFLWLTLPHCLASKGHSVHS